MAPGVRLCIVLGVLFLLASTLTRDVCSLAIEHDTTSGRRRAKWPQKNIYSNAVFNVLANGGIYQNNVKEGLRTPT